MPVTLRKGAPCVKRCLDEREAMIASPSGAADARPPLPQRHGSGVQCGISRPDVFAPRLSQVRTGMSPGAGTARTETPTLTAVSEREKPASRREGPAAAGRRPDINTSGTVSSADTGSSPATRSMNTLSQGLRVRRRPARVSRRLWSSSFQQLPDRADSALHRDRGGMKLLGGSPGRDAWRSNEGAGIGRHPAQRCIRCS